MGADGLPKKRERWKDIYGKRKVFGVYEETALSKKTGSLPKNL